MKLAGKIHHEELFFKEDGTANRETWGFGRTTPGSVFPLQ
jgi:hypothetical protein